MFGKKKENRFKISDEKVALSSSYIIQDTKTGVNYLFHASGYAGGITPLLDEHGKVVITPVVDEDN